MSDERRIIGYDVGTGGDGGPVFARADGAGESVDARPAGDEVPPCLACAGRPVVPLQREGVGIAHCGACGRRLEEPLPVVDEDEAPPVIPTWLANLTPEAVARINAIPTTGPAPWDIADGALAEAIREPIATPESEGTGAAPCHLCDPGDRSACFAKRPAMAGVCVCRCHNATDKPGQWSRGGEDTGASAPLPCPDCGSRACFAGVNECEAAKRIATTERANAVASNPLLPADHPLASRPRRVDAVGLVEGPFVPSAKAAAETVEALRRVGEEPIMRSGDLDRAIGYARGTVASGLVDDGTILSRALLTVVAERDRLTRELTSLDKTLGETIAASAEHASQRDALRARVAELEADQRAHAKIHADALGREGAKLHEIDALRERVAELEAERNRWKAAAHKLASDADTADAARPDHAADALALTLAAEQSIRGWLRAHGHDPDARPWDEQVIALLDAPPVGSVAGLLAEMKQAREEGDGGGWREAIETVKRHLGAPAPADAVGKVVAEVLASIGDCSFGLDPVSYLEGAQRGAAHARKNFADGDAANARADMVSAACSLLCAIVACDAAKGAPMGKPTCFVKGDSLDGDDVCDCRRDNATPDDACACTTDPGETVKPGEHPICVNCGAEVYDHAAKGGAK